MGSNEPRDLRWGAQKRIVMVLATMFIAACSSGKAATPSPSPSPDPSPSVNVEAQVLAAWHTEHMASAALRALNPNDPALAQSAINPVLQHARAYIAVAKAQGIVVRGSQDLGTPKVISLTPAADATKAIVESCVHDGLVLLNGKTGKPVPGLAGQTTWNLERTTLTLVEGVGWMVSDNNVKQDLKESVCTAS